MKKVEEPEIMYQGAVEPEIKKMRRKKMEEERERKKERWKRENTGSRRQNKIRRKIKARKVQGKEKAKGRIMGSLVRGLDVHHLEANDYFRVLFKAAQINNFPMPWDLINAMSKIICKTAQY